MRLRALHPCCLCSSISTANHAILPSQTCCAWPLLPPPKPSDIFPLPLRLRPRSSSRACKQAINLSNETATTRVSQSAVYLQVPSKSKPDHVKRYLTPEPLLFQSTARRRWQHQCQSRDEAQPPQPDRTQPTLCPPRLKAILFDSVQTLLFTPQIPQNRSSCRETPTCP